ncbi:uncharacterized protein MYCFIDRAFT_206731 [Pseudocercospora fijiensis CIRAD86]|uniref:Uncharacterized protein n=1 Tax=Pseudocercospora fijiensis (strain CIRAD86) TaxID=383855 RepID=M2Z8R5_PSEFD|nr:uncharacterized protein MYCFIDRAFT_206731 [Pseudocercospora fijiensis CIRAD86]EME86175.1 hypothetical protein MYCFIDRAFT_206731 [Pseudocercospora fijiensis CIRAD86]
MAKLRTRVVLVKQEQQEGKSEDNRSGYGKASSSVPEPEPEPAPGLWQQVAGGSSSRYYYDRTDGEGGGSEVCVRDVRMPPQPTQAAGRMERESAPVHAPSVSSDQGLERQSHAIMASGHEAHGRKEKVHCPESYRCPYTHGVHPMTIHGTQINQLRG